MSEIKRDERGRLLPGQVLNPNGFKKGVSGNPGGRPKEASKMRISNAFLLELAKKVRKGEEDKTKLEALIEKIMADALEGNYKAIELVLDRTFGKAKEFVEVTQNEVRIIDSLEDEAEENEPSNPEGGEITP